MDILTDGSTVVLSGNFDGRSTFRVRSAINERLAAGAETDIVVDLTGVGSVDVPALRVLACAHAAPRSGRHVRLRGCSPQVVRMLLLTRLMRFVELDRNAARAVARVHNPTPTTVTSA